MPEKIKSIATKVGFWISVASALVLLLLFNREKRRYGDLKLAAEQAALKNKLEAIQNKAAKSEADYSRAYGDYQRLKRTMPDVFKRLGLPTDESAGNNGTDGKS